MILFSVRVGIHQEFMTAADSPAEKWPPARTA